MSAMRSAEVIIVGGGPAGAACAWKLRQRGADALLLDAAQFPRVKLCAGWITPQVLRDLETSPAQYPGGLTHFRRFEVWIKRLHIRLPTDQYAIRRVEFDDWLLRRAGVETLRHAVRTVRYAGGQYILDEQYAARWLVGAGGTRCPVRRALFEPPQSRARGTLIVAQEEEFATPHADPRCHLWFLQNGLPGYAWYVPKAGGFVNVGVGGDAAALKAKGDSLRRHWDLLAQKLEREGLVRGHAFQPGGHAYFLRARRPDPRRGNALLVGDALGLATLDMGEGIGPAIRSGLLAAQAILEGGEYSPAASIARYSFPTLLGWRE